MGRVGQVSLPGLCRVEQSLFEARLETCEALPYLTIALAVSALELDPGKAEVA